MIVSKINSTKTTPSEFPCLMELPETNTIFMVTSGTFNPKYYAGFVVSSGASKVFGLGQYVTRIDGDTLVPFSGSVTLSDM